MRLLQRKVNLLYFLSLLFVLILFSAKIFAASSLTKFDNNPLEVVLAQDQSSILQSNIFRVNSDFFALFSMKDSANHYSLNLGKSLDGLSWTIEKNILNFQNNLYAPRLLRLNNVNKVFFTEETSGGLRISSIDCDSDFNCDSSTIKLIRSRTNGTWYSQHAASGFVIKDPNIDKYYLFFTGYNGSQWQVGVAYSTNLINWTDCGNQPTFENRDGSYVYFKDPEYIILTHAANSSGIEISSSNNSLSCNMSWSNPEYILTPGSTYDSSHLISPSVIDVNGISYIYYSGRNGQFGWTLNLATDQPIPQATPTPTQTPTPTILPTATPTPSPTPLPKIVLIPGLFGSWNEEAILHQQQVSQSEWYLTPIFHEIDGLIQTLQNLGYILNQNLFTFAYDWRQPIESSANQLKTFIDNHSSTDDTVKIVGHSLGGLVGRIYAQKYLPNELKKLITVGSPHDGTAHTYKVVSAGIIDKNDTQFYLAEQSILQLYKTYLLQSDQDVINENLPVLRDLLPIFPYLKNTNGAFTPINSMNLQNFLLFSYNENFNDLNPILHTIAGNNLNTLFGYNITPPTQLDLLLDRYSDGRPLTDINSQGDGLVLTSSVSKGNNPTILNNYYHGDILAKKPAIKKMLDNLDINYTDDDVVAGDQTPISPALIFFIQSPATMRVIFNNNTFNEQNGMIYIPNAQNGNYLLKVVGENIGNYTVTLGEVGVSSDFWTKIRGKITKNPPSSQTDTYAISFNSDRPDPTSLNLNTLYSQFISSLDNISTNDPIQKNAIKNLKSKLQNILKTKNQNQPSFLRSRFVGLQSQLISYALSTKGETLNLYLISIDLFEKYFTSYFGNKFIDANSLGYQLYLADLATETAKILNLDSFKKSLFNLSLEKIDLARQYKTLQPNYSYILLTSALKILTSLVL